MKNKLERIIINFNYNKFSHNKISFDYSFFSGSFI